VSGSRQQASLLRRADWLTQVTGCMLQVILLRSGPGDAGPSSTAKDDAQTLDILRRLSDLGYILVARRRRVLQVVDTPPEGGQSAGGPGISTANFTASFGNDSGAPRPLPQPQAEQAQQRLRRLLGGGARRLTQFMRAHAIGRDHLPWRRQDLPALIAKQQAVLQQAARQGHAAAGSDSRAQPPHPPHQHRQPSIPAAAAAAAKPTAAQHHQAKQEEIRQSQQQLQLQAQAAARESAAKVAKQQQQQLGVPLAASAAAATGSNAAAGQGVTALQAALQVAAQQQEQTRVRRLRGLPVSFTFVRLYRQIAAHEAADAQLWSACMAKRQKHRESMATIKATLARQHEERVAACYSSCQNDTAASPAPAADSPAPPGSNSSSSNSSTAGGGGGGGGAAAAGVASSAGAHNASTAPAGSASSSGADAGRALLGDASDWPDGRITANATASNQTTLCSACAKLQPRSMIYPGPPPCGPWPAPISGGC